MCWHFMACFILKNGPKREKQLIFTKKANTSKSRQRYVLLMEKCQKPEIWPSCTQKQYKEKFQATFLFLTFAQIWGYCRPKFSIFVIFHLLHRIFISTFLNILFSSFPQIVFHSRFLKSNCILKKALTSGILLGAVKYTSSSSFFIALRKAPVFS